MYPDGTLVRGPKTLCELQGYVYDAWLHMAEIYEGSATSAAPTLCARRPQRCSKSSTRSSGTNSPAAKPALAGEKKKCFIRRPMSEAARYLWSGIIAPERATAAW